MQSILAIVVVAFLSSLLAAQDPFIEISPKVVLLGEPLSILVKHLSPLKQYSVKARQIAKQGEVYSSSVSLISDDKGFLDLSKAEGPNQAPLRVLWSMTREVDASITSKRTSDLEPLVTTIVVELNGKTVATATLNRLTTAENIIREPLRTNGLAGTVFRPQQAGKYPVIIAFGGSGGGLSEAREALLASYGFVVVALAYFNYESLPKFLSEIPLEYFGKAIEWTMSQPFVKQDMLAVMGTSRGGELALLLGATYPQVKCVIAYAPSHVVWPGGPRRSAWSYQGKPVPYMSKFPDGRIARELMKADPASNTPAFLLQLADMTEVKQASIAVEKIRGPVLLFSGEDDRLWPSTYMAEQVMERLKEHQHPYASEHHRYKQSGHSFPLPGLPPPENRRIHRVTKQEIAYGGSVQGTAFASWDSWRQLLRFLKIHFTP